MSPTPDELLQGVAALVIILAVVLSPTRLGRAIREYLAGQYRMR